MDSIFGLIHGWGANRQSLAMLGLGVEVVGEVGVLQQDVYWKVHEDLFRVLHCAVEQLEVPPGHQQQAHNVDRQQDSCHGHQQKLCFAHILFKLMVDFHCQKLPQFKYFLEVTDDDLDVVILQPGIYICGVFGNLVNRIPVVEAILERTD